MTDSLAAVMPAFAPLVETDTSAQTTSFEEILTAAVPDEDAPTPTAGSAEDTAWVPMTVPVFSWRPPLETTPLTTDVAEIGAPTEGEREPVQQDSDTEPEDIVLAATPLANGSNPPPSLEQPLAPELPEPGAAVEDHSQPVRWVPHLDQRVHQPPELRTSNLIDEQLEDSTAPPIVATSEGKTAQPSRDRESKPEQLKPALPAEPAAQPQPPIPEPAEEAPPLHRSTRVAVGGSRNDDEQDSTTTDSPKAVSRSASPPEQRPEAQSNFADKVDQHKSYDPIEHILRHQAVIAPVPAAPATGETRRRNAEGPRTQTSAFPRPVEQNIIEPAVAPAARMDPAISGSLRPLSSEPEVANPDAAPPAAPPPRVVTAHTASLAEHPGGQDAWPAAAQSPEFREAPPEARPPETIVTPVRAISVDVPESKPEARPATHAPVPPQPYEAPHAPRTVEKLNVSVGGNEGEPRAEILLQHKPDGAIQMAVRTADPQLAQSLRSGLPELNSSLEARGYRSELHAEPPRESNNDSQDQSQRRPRWFYERNDDD